MEESTSDRINAARNELIVAVKLSGQRSYHRRTPLPDCLPHYRKAKRLLSEVLQQEPKNLGALLMMSQVAEGLMDFDAAIEYLESAFDKGEPKTKKLLKRLALLRENAKEWKGLALTPEELRDLGEYLESMRVDRTNRTLDFTCQWLSLKFNGNPKTVICALNERGAFSDFQVLVNVVYG